MISRFGPRTTRAPRPSRVPIARSEWPEMSGATSGASAARSVDRSTSMYASTGASEVTTPRAAPGRGPSAPDRTTRTSVSSAASSAAIRGVSSTLALSAIVMRAENGKLLSQMAMQPVHRIGEGGLLVVHRHHDVEHGHAGRAGGQRRRSAAIRSRVPAGAAFEGDVCHDIHRRARSLCCPLAQAYASYEFFGG